MAAAQGDAGTQRKAVQYACILPAVLTVYGAMLNQENAIEGSYMPYALMGQGIILGAMAIYSVYYKN